MPARLFRSTQRLFSRLNKTVLLATVVIAFTAISTQAFAADTAPVDYSGYINNFTTSDSNNPPVVISGLTGGTVQNSTSTNDATGLVFNINIGIDSSTESVENHWKRLAIGPDTIVIELCKSTDPNTCWLSTVKGSTDSSVYNPNDNLLHERVSNNYLDSEVVPQSAFTNTVGAAGGLFSYVPSSNTATSIPSLILGKGNSYNATLWYCATAPGDTAPVGVAGNPTKFGSLCGGSSYFQIGGVLPVNIPADTSSLQAQTVASQQALASNSSISGSNKLPACGIGTGALASAAGVNGTISGCAADVAYGIYWLTAWIAGLFGELFDFFIGYSVSSASYGYPFVLTGWKLVRDISNIFFIIIMVWSGFAAVFDTSKNGWKDVVPNLIVNAILINFSLFATRVVIDISNITARMFYSEMLVCKQVNLDSSGNCPPAKAERGLGGYWPLSEKIVSSFNPQQMFKPSILNPPTTNTTDGTQNTTAQTTSTGVAVDSASQTAIYFGVISLVAAAIMIAIAIMFFKVTFLFVGRTVGLYICMIFSPFAFLSRGNVPLVGSIEKLNWKDWWKDLASYAMLAPIFIFFLYIIYTFLSSNFVQQIGVQALASSGFFATVMSIVIPMLIIYFLIVAAQKQASKYAGDIGRSIQSFGEKASGVIAGTALGVATGGASLAATGGAKFTDLSPEKRAQLEAKKAAGGFSGWTAKQQLKASDWTQKQSFNARDNKGFQNLSNKLGLKPNETLLSALGFAKDRTKGGREGMIDRSKKTTKKEIESIKTKIKDADVPAFWAAHMNPKIAKVAEKEYLKGKTAEEKAAFKKSKRDGTLKSNADYTKTLEAKLAESEKLYGKVTTNKQLQQALRAEYAGTLLNEPMMGNTPGADTARIAAVGKAGIISSAIPLVGGLMGGAAGIGVAGLYAGATIDNTGKRKAAQEFLDANEKSLKKKPRGDRLEEESGAITKKLEAIENTQKETYAKIAKNKIENDPNHKDKPEDEKETLINQEVKRLQENTEDATQAIRAFRTALQNTFDQIDLDVQYLNTQHKEALKNSNNDPDDEQVKDLAAKLAERIADRNKTKADYEALDPAKKERLESERTKIDGQIEQLKEKEEKSKGGGDDKPKDDKK